MTDIIIYKKDFDKVADYDKAMRFYLEKGCKCKSTILDGEKEIGMNLINYGDEINPDELKKLLAD
jgi:hypothetical protein